MSNSADKSKLTASIKNIVVGISQQSNNVMINFVSCTIISLSLICIFFPIDNFAFGYTMLLITTLIFDFARCVGWRQGVEVFDSDIEIYRTMIPNVMFILLAAKILLCS